MYVPWPGTELPTLWCMGGHYNELSHTSQGHLLLFNYNILILRYLYIYIYLSGFRAYFFLLWSRKSQYFSFLTFQSNFHFNFIAHVFSLKKSWLSGRVCFYMTSHSCNFKTILFLIIINVLFYYFMFWRKLLYSNTTGFSFLLCFPLICLCPKAIGFLLCGLEGCVITAFLGDIFQSSTIISKETILISIIIIISMSHNFESLFQSLV